MKISNIKGSHTFEILIEGRGRGVITMGLITNEFDYTKSHFIGHHSISNTWYSYIMGLMYRGYISHGQISNYFTNLACKTKVSPWGLNDRVGVLVNMQKKVLRFYLNGEWQVRIFTRKIDSLTRDFPYLKLKKIWCCILQLHFIQTMTK